MLWRERYPELVEFIDGRFVDGDWVPGPVARAVDPYGETYRRGMDQAEIEYGLSGVETQLLYIANNLKPGNTHVADELEDWSRWIKEDRLNDQE